MNKTRFSHKVIAVILTLNFIQTFIPFNMLFASNGGPKSPEASSFEPVDAMDMVSLLTGDLSYVLPLLEIPSPEGGYPIALSYHAGISLDQEASWVGLGWNINPGAIDRNISGYPDDWKNGKKADIVFDKGGVSESIYIGDNIGIPKFGSIGRYYSYSSNKTFGGETIHRSDFGYNANIGPISGKLGTDDVSVGINVNIIDGLMQLTGNSNSKSLNNINNNIGLSVGASYSLKKGEYNLSTNGNLKQYGLGVSLSSSKGFSASIGSNNVSLTGNNNLSTEVSFTNTNINITIPILPLLSIDFGYNKSRYWLFDKSNLKCLGSLYSGHLRQSMNDAIFSYTVVSDSYESIYKANQNLQFTQNNLALISYDNYNVTGQGIGGSISPNLYEHGTLKLKNQKVANGTSFYLYDDSFTKQMVNNDVYFNFNETYSSFLRVKADKWVLPSSNLNEITDLQLNGKGLNSSVIIDGFVKDNYNTQKKRIITGPYIEVFTNQEIVNNPKKILGARNFNRSLMLSSSNMSDGFGDGIGAYKITGLDGKTYHYSLPVYQLEKFTRSSEKKYDFELKFYEEQNFTPYATHWLLTAVTGPDYVDTNYNGYPDVQDYGYWVEFEYGKWSDGYTWRNPSINFVEGENSKSYSWGIKEIYYLDKIKTRTHTALFIKEDRLDNLSSEINIHNPNDLNLPKTYHDNTIKKFSVGNDGYLYLNGIYSTFSNKNFISVISADATYSFFANINKHKTLRLKEIILLQNKNLPAELSTYNLQEKSSSFVGSMLFKEKINYYNILGQFIGSENYTATERTWYGEYYSNILDVKDINILTPNIRDNAIKVINFNYDENYPLAQNSSNSDALNKGRLTLQNVVFKGKGGVQQIPPYSFSYNQPTVIFNYENMDNWGYNKNTPSIWSLNEIQDPLGGKIKVNYESDDFHDVATGGKRTFSSNIQLQFIGADPGEKWVNIRWNPNYAYINDPVNDFRNYFQVGDYSLGARIEYARHGDNNDTNYNKWIARILNQDLQVTSVSQSQIQLRLPTIGEPNENFDIQTLCDDDNLIYYRDYDDNSESVIAKTSGFSDVNEICDIGSKGTQSVKGFIQATKNLFKNSKGGGVRVKSIETLDNIGNVYKKEYYYNNKEYEEDPNSINYKSSGITSYAPSKYFQEIPFRSELPAPAVMYNRVKVKNVNSNNTNSLSTIYSFKTLAPATQTQTSFELGDVLRISTKQSDVINNISVSGKNSSIQLFKYEIEKNFSSIGRLSSLEIRNSYNQIITKKNNNYKSPEQIKQGIRQESFNLFKGINSTFDQDEMKYRVNVTSKIDYPSVLESSNTIESNFSYTTFFDKNDFNTGQLLETRTYASDGTAFKTKTVPAYTKYPQMGSKVDNVTNKNMLTQQAASYTYLLDEVNNTEKVIGVGITTWNNNWFYRDHSGLETTPTNDVEKIWRKHKSFVWDGDIDGDGAYVGFNTTNDDAFLWITPEPPFKPAPTKWKQVSEITLYDHYSAPLETMNINYNYSSIKMCEGDSKIMAVSNAKYTEMFYSGAEYLSPNNNLFFDGEVKSLGLSSVKAHTGTHSVMASANQHVFEVNLKTLEHRSGKYKVSVWVDKTNYLNARININGSTKTFNGEQIIAGDWVLLNHYEDLSYDAETVYLTSASGTSYFDDFRLLPIASSITSYVYNDWDELWYIIGNNGLATRYEYDEAGRLIRRFNEVVDNGLITGGFKQISQHNYHYKNQQ